ncbi:hypothetical protein [Hamadaea tsunoensis]|uniref:hypothetical protein n=1 Tax=Hamadaea tsunoensis TaxID=53368 RepID=UPI00041D0269|nr:hypothetical protein [Hamadaea tsunoensis]
MSIGQGAIKVTFAYPSFGGGYADSSPRLTIDGIEQPVRAWGSHVLPVAAGPHTLRILVDTPGGDSFGLAEAPVTVGLGDQVAVDYRAPRFHGARGRIRVKR